MKITKARLLALLKGRGYDGDGSLESVKAFVDSDDGFDLVDATGKSIDLDKVFRKTVTITADAGEDVQVIAPEGADEPAMDGEAKMEDEDEEDDEVAKAYKAGLARGRRGKASGVRDGDTGSRVTRVSGSGGTFKGAVAAYNQRVQRKHLMPADKRPVFCDGIKAMAAGAYFRQKFREQAGGHAYLVGKADNDLAILSDYFGQKASSTMDLTGGAGFVPEDFSSDIIENVEEYGVARANAQVETMSRDVQHFPVHTADGSWSLIGEGAAVTESDPTNTNVKLTAGKWGRLSRVSSELVNDGVINWGDYIGRAFGRSLANAEDTSMFIGNGLTAHRFVNGISTKLQDFDLGSGTDSAGLVSASGNTFAEFVLGDFDEVCGTLPDYADGNAKWYCSRAFYFKVMLPLETTGGSGTPMSEIEGRPARMFRGYPVVFTQVMPTAEADTTVFAHFGDLSMGAMLGTVAGTMQIDFSDQRYFDTDQLAFRGLQRTAINVHDIGNATRVGPIVGLQSIT